MPRILRILNRFNLGGPSYNAAYLTKYLGQEFETLLIGGLKNDDEDSSEFIFHNFGVTPLIIEEMRRPLNLLEDRKAYKRIRKIIAEFQPDIVHTHAAKAGALGRMAAFSKKVPVVVHTFHGHVFHSYFGRAKTEMFKLFERRMSARTDAIVAISETQKRELTLDHRICDEDKVHVIPLGFDLDRFQQDRDEKRKAFRKQYGIADGEISVGIVGRLVPIKNHKLFLEGFARALKRAPGPLKAVVIGDGELKESLQALAVELQIAPQVIFTSWIRNIDTAYAGLDIVSLTSLNEGTPVSLIEAQAAGLPVISSKVGGVEDAVCQSDSGILFASGNADEFAACLLKMLSGLGTLQQSGREFVKERFHYTALVKGTRNMYKSLLQNRQIQAG